MRFSLNITSTTFLMFTASLLVLAIVHNVAVALSLYWKYWWFDIPMHFLGGVVVVLGLLAVVRIHEACSFTRGLFISLGFVLIIGLVWEVFEYSAGILVVTEKGILVDTIVDLSMDMAGGVVGYLVSYGLRPLDELTDGDI